MEELIAKRYIKAIQEVSNEADFETISDLFGALAGSFEDEKFLQSGRPIRLIGVRASTACR